MKANQGRKAEMLTANSWGIDKTAQSPLTSDGESDSILQARKRRFAQPTAEEVIRLTFGKLGEFRIHQQEARNHFAFLLNRGSSLE